MAVLYTKGGEEINVPHPIDVKERLASGELSLDKPKPKVKPKAKPKTD